MAALPGGGKGEKKKKKKAQLARTFNCRAGSLKGLMWFLLPPAPGEEKEKEWGERRIPSTPRE